jgi:hypothetical protein
LVADKRKPAHALFGLQTPNLGDDLQALTVATISPHVTTLINRERIGWAQVSEPHVFVMNFWFMSKGFRWAPHHFIEPIFHGFCVGRDELLKYRWPDYLRQHQPIGCRDVHSVEMLKARGIEAMWTGCITMFLGRYVQPIPAARRKGVVFVDVPPEAEALIPKEISREAIRITNTCPPAIRDDPIQRWARIAAISDRLRYARLVVTRRLHTALPCVGFQTPVVLVLSSQSKDLRRFSGYERFMPLLLHGPGQPASRLEWDRVEASTIPDELVAHFERLLVRMRAVFGSINEAVAPALACRNRFRIPNPGLGAMPGIVRFDLGNTSIVRLPHQWSDRSIELDVDGFSGLERFDIPVEVQGFDQRRGLPVGRLRDHAIGNWTATESLDL